MADGPSGAWSLTSDGETVCPWANCTHLEQARSGVLARQAAHEMERHERVVAGGDGGGDG